MPTRTCRFWRRFSHRAYRSLLLVLFFSLCWNADPYTDSMSSESRTRRYVMAMWSGSGVVLCYEERIWNMNDWCFVHDSWQQHHTIIKSSINDSIVPLHKSASLSSNNSIQIQIFFSTKQVVEIMAWRSSGTDNTEMVDKLTRKSLCLLLLVLDETVAFGWRSMHCMQWSRT